MSFLLAIEGGDGAGKGTATAEVASQLRDMGLTATMLSFPRYADTAAGYVIGEFLSGRLPREVTPHAAATLYALDRFESREALHAARATSDVVVLDRYIASNMAYQAAKLPADGREAFMTWVLALETGTFGLPRADLSAYLDTPVEVSRDLIRLKHQRTYTTRTYDEYEADEALQRQVRQNYAAMVTGSLGGDWTTIGTVGPDGLLPPAAIGAAIVAQYRSRTA